MPHRSVESLGVGVVYEHVRLNIRQRNLVFIRLTNEALGYALRTIVPAE